MKRVTIYSDGGCEPNPGVGGWAAVLEYGQRRRELSGGALASTNNRMELQAAIAALRALKESCQVELFTDSEYVRNGMTRWLRGWRSNGWRTVAKKPVKNGDLWRELDQLAARHQITWHWLKGHAGHPQNDRCDQLAGEAIRRVRDRHPASERKQALARFTGKAAESALTQPELLRRP